jgi:hypothetical protein
MTVQSNPKLVNALAAATTVITMPKRPKSSGANRRAMITERMIARI